MNRPAPGSLHHVELWVPDLARAITQWGWLLSQLGHAPFQDWPDGRSWRLGSTYLVVEQSPAMTASDHDRLRPGVNHLAFHAGTRHHVDALAAEGPAYGWTLLFPDAHPHAGWARSLRGLPHQYRRLRGRTRRQQNMINHKP